MAVPKSKEGLAPRTIILIAALLVPAATGVVLVREYAAKSLEAMCILGSACPPLISDASIARNLNSDDKHLVYSSLSLLASRDNRVGMDKAMEMMSGDDGWIHGALYLGHFGDVSAVPFLLKALRHHFASGLYPEMAADLEKLTGQHYGTDFQKWSAWWRQTHPEEHFDFDSHLDT